MAGGGPDDGSHYSPKVGGMYIFNLIVGAGALAMPQAFARSGYLGGSILLAILALSSYVTVTFMIEAMAIANACLRVIKPTNNKDSSVNRDDEKEILISPLDSEGKKNPYEIEKRTEMGFMAELFFSPLGVKLFYLTITVYLYGDLCIYAVAVPKSLQKVTCEGSDTRGSAKCFGSLTRQHAYYVYLTLFALILGPFCFTNVTKTKWLQVTTTLLRWVTFSVMIIIALIGIASGDPFKEGDPKPPSIHDVPVAGFGYLPQLFGTSIYSFMCHHSLPSLVTPIQPKKQLNWLLVVDFIMVSSFYYLLCYTAMFRFPAEDLDDLYTLNFKDYHIKFFSYFLGLFPVITLSANFPIIGITLRNNLKTLFARKGKQFPTFVDQVVFPMASIAPPIIVAFFTEDVGALVGFTGSYAGVGIQYVIPALLCYCGRKKIAGLLHQREKNPHSSPFQHRYFIYGIVIWSAVCIILVTFNHICDAYDSCKYGVLHMHKDPTTVAPLHGHAVTTLG